MHPRQRTFVCHADKGEVHANSIFDFAGFSKFADDGRPLMEVARGKITLEGYLQAFPGTQSLMTGANLFATAPADSQTPVSTEVQESTEAVVIEAPVTQETAGQTALEPMFEATVEPVVEAQTEPTVEAQPEPTSVQPET